jgi:hypothetical protein
MRYLFDSTTVDTNKLLIYLVIFNAVILRIKGPASARCL